VSGVELKRELEVLSRARVLLGHQSVGRDVLSGVRLLADEAGVPLRIEPITGAPQDAGAGIFESTIGNNGDPNGKCEAFAALLSHPQQPSYDAAMMKFCYVDLHEGAPLDGSQLLDRYVALVARVRAARPDVRIVHVTMPLRSDPLEWKTPIKRLLGRSTYEDGANELRNAYNIRLRERFANEPIFDLARAQSTLTDGSRSAFHSNGRPIYTLAKPYTYDGGHLNDLGQRVVAAHFVRSLAAVIQAAPQASTT
jgi:hypothetical protein